MPVDKVELGGVELPVIAHTGLRCWECESEQFFVMAGERDFAAHCLACGRWFQGSVRPSTVVRRGEPYP